MATERPVQAAAPPTALPVDIVIFGGTGDLTFRKLMPALYMAHVHGRIDAGTRIIAVGRQDWSPQAYGEFLDARTPSFVSREAFDDGQWQAFKNRLHYVSVDLEQAAAYNALRQTLNRPAVRVFYMATAPTLFTTICAHLARMSLIDAQARLVLEKPLGHDLASARAINDEVACHFQERQIYRIDHYLGKETVQNLMVLRFGNAIFEPLWRGPSIRSVQITVSETVGVGSRAGFYDAAGAMRDMVQNHLLQLLCIVAMEPPISLDADDVRDEKLKVLRALRPMSPADIQRDTVRGQYAQGVAGGESVIGYLDEEGVAPGSRTETFVALRVHLNNARWAHVPFFLRTGKRMARRESQIVIEFAEQPFSIFGLAARQQPNRLIITLQPEESIQLEMMVKEPGSGMHIHPVKLGLDLQQSSDKRRADAYERLLLDVLKGRLTHFMRRDELEAAWHWVDPVLQGWASLNDRPRPYVAGTWGPAASSALMAREGLAWFEEA